MKGLKWCAYLIICVVLLRLTAVAAVALIVLAVTVALIRAPKETFSILFGFACLNALAQAPAAAIGFTCGAWLLARLITHWRK